MSLSHYFYLSVSAVGLLRHHFLFDDRLYTLRQLTEEHFTSPNYWHAKGFLLQVQDDSAQLKGLSMPLVVFIDHGRSVTTRIALVVKLMQFYF